MKLDSVKHPESTSSYHAVPDDESARNWVAGSQTLDRPVFSRPSSALERGLLKRLLAACGNPSIRIVLWDGAAVGVPVGSQVGDVVVRDPVTLRRLLFDPRVAFGDAYSDGSIEIHGPLVEVLSSICLGVERAASGGLLARIVNRPRRRRSHTLAASRESVHHHYDIGNDFYRLWLDERLQYTCAYYAKADFTIDQAQLAKLDHVCRKMQLKPGERVLEAGCGWGGLALHMAERYGVSVRAFNLSREQIDYARQRAASTGLAGLVEYVEDDYRNASGKYDAFVSVGMLEHVGPENYGELGRVIDRSLTPNGRGLIHSIGRNQPRALDPWTEKRIFPGAYPPSLGEMLQIFEPTGFSVLDVENLRLHYARTLEHWLERFERAAAKAAEMFDARFVRMWRMYLAGSIASFKSGGLQLFQVVFARESNNNVPWTRSHLYAAQPDS
ncbi:MAG TPA: cyclopropane-fatty-acyl-phospholipid synthase family protein [Planctomycetaceae bacterium]|nr:cyclopropane-fatty-acyl-phospholipid synthase family protein [Planctomycetaceae bacterium]